MEKKIKVEIEFDNLQDLKELAKLPDYQSLVFELLHNFNRKFKNLDHKSSDFNEGVQHVLDALREEIYKNLE